MHPIRGRRAQAGFSIKRVLGLVLTIVLLGFWTMRHANFVLGRALYMAFPADDTTYRAAWPSLTGSISAKDVVFPAADGTDLKEFRFDEVRVEVPMGQYLLSALSRRGRLNAITEVRIALTGGRGEYGLPFTSSLGVFGAASSAPFEADGCVEDSLWTSDELARMGLKPGPTELTVEFKREQGRLTLTQTQRTPGVASVSYHGVVAMNDDYSLFSLRDGGRNALLSDSWSVRDEGFVAARNHYCAGKDKITPEQFVQRHVATVQRVLAAEGLHANDEMAAAYRQFASRGGSLEFGVDYDPPLTAERYAEAHFGEWLGQVRGRFSVDGKPQAFGLETRPPLPLPEDDEDAESVRTVFDVLRAEGGDPLRLATADAADAADAAATMPQSTEIPAIAATTAAPASAVPGTAAAAPAGTIVLKPATAATPPPTAKPAAAPEPKALVVVPAAHTTVVSSAGRIDPDQAAAGAAPITAGTRVTYAQLGKMIGQNARVFLKTRPPMQGQVVREDKGIVYLRRHLGSGYAVLEIDPKAFDYAEAVR
ncbi:hypothetical protein [Tahibacter caeni]|uniref:hypothetical protein n=1 Tax=Tahibacter caeni TaxID=1453545 RepID=UPI002148FE7E|nr:hypothetical protein [Tahibacter caeni]